MSNGMEKIPPDVLEVVREFLAEGMPIDQIAFMARVSEGVVRRVAAETDSQPPVNTTTNNE
ncbi:hypothetical protein BGCPKDLD_5167 [Methylorubrum suomiense]|uniref:Resolvase HTH domain-containing protein n=1 Tax=Methylorubrum suomiense TaxID=144191 RepID=A0ABQ4V3I3_9HYPH|nr:hypothetical protein BGCPKDLD_5167 [Methylorubrum suomiense]